MKPIANRVLIKNDPAEEVISGFIMPDSLKEKPLRGEVVACGSECKWVKVGDKVLYKQFTGAEIRGVDGEPLVILIEPTDIFLIL